MVRATSYPYLMSALLDAWDWFDESLQMIVKEAGFRPLNRSQSLMMLYIVMGFQRPIEIARRMRLSRQAISHMTDQLVTRGILLVSDDPNDKRSKILSFAPDSSDMRTLGRATILDLDDVLRSRISSERFEALREALFLDWGVTVKSSLQLPSKSRVAAYMRDHPPAKTRRASR